MEPENKKQWEFVRSTTRAWHIYSSNASPEYAHTQCARTVKITKRTSGSELPSTRSQPMCGYCDGIFFGRIPALINAPDQGI